METKVIILGEAEAVKPELKKIEFTSFIGHDRVSDAVANPSEYKNIELVCRNYIVTGLDIMFAYGENRNNGAAYLGHFNDGIV